MTSNCVRRRQNRVGQAWDTYREVTALICNNKKEAMDLWHVIPITVYGAEKQGSSSSSSSSIYFNSTTSISQYSNKCIQYRHNGKLNTFLDIR